MFLSERKLMKMLFDTDAFMSAAIYLQVVLEQEYYSKVNNYTADRGEFGRMLSLSTAMQTNLGMAIELALKRVVYVNGYSKCINEHELNGIYKLLSCEVKTNLGLSAAQWICKCLLYVQLELSMILKKCLEEGPFKTY